MRFSEFSRVTRVAYYSAFGAFVALILFLGLWIVGSSFKSTIEIFSSPFSLPLHPILSNFSSAWENGNFGDGYLNSFLITGTSVLGIVVFEGLAGYAFARLEFRGKTALFWVFLVGQAVPAQMVVLPSFLEIAQLHLGDTQIGLIFQYLSWAPFALLFFRASFLAIPFEVEEAARIDGASRLQILRKIVFPMTKGAFASVGVIYALWIWSDLLFPLAYLRTPSKFTVPLGLASFSGTYTTYWGQLVAAVIIVSVPPIAFFLGMRRYIESGFSLGALNQ
ncbi:MAG: carbohydrate ABC transporter permease [Acidimicrobiales bacterium]